MRKISQEAINAFMNYQKFSKSNTTVIYYNKNACLYLHGNLIAVRNRIGRIFFSLAGYPSNTTRERLNAIPNLSVKQIQGNQFANGVEISSKKWYMLTPYATIKSVKDIRKYI